MAIARTGGANRKGAIRLAFALVIRQNEASRLHPGCQNRHGLWQNYGLSGSAWQKYA
jgi:hypothetical protein